MPQDLLKRISRIEREIRCIMCSGSQVTNELTLEGSTLCSNVNNVESCVDLNPAIDIIVGTTNILSGTNQRIPFNDGGIYNEDPDLFFDKTANNLQIGSSTPTSNGILGLGGATGTGTITGNSGPLLVTARGLTLTTTSAGTGITMNTGATQRLNVSDAGLLTTAFTNLTVTSTAITSQLGVNLTFPANTGNILTIGNTSNVAYNMQQFRTLTTDATPTTTTSVTTPTNTIWRITADVLAMRTGGAAGAVGDVATYQYDGRFKNIGGTVTLIGETITVSDESDPTWNVRGNISGTAIRFQVVGAVNTNITWNIANLEITRGAF